MMNTETSTSLKGEGFVGRERPLAWLASARARAAQREPWLVLIEGPSGIGKSALMSRFRLGCDSPWLGRGHFGDSGRPLDGLLQAVAELIRVRLQVDRDGLAGEVLAAVGPELARLVRVLPRLSALTPQTALSTDVPRGRYAAFNAAQTPFEVLLARLVSAFATDAPVVLMLDDLHRADRPSLAFVEAILRHRSAGVLIVATARTAASPHLRSWLDSLSTQRLSVERVRIPALDPDQTQRLVQAHLGAPVDRLPALASTLYHASAGNPFHTLQALEQLIESGRLKQRDGRWIWTRFDTPCPSAVELVGQRVDTLGELTSRALGVASLIGDTFHRNTLLDVLGWAPGPVDKVLGAAVDAGHILPSGQLRFVFAHDRVRESLVGITLDDAPGLHLKVALSLLARGDGPAAHCHRICDHLLEARSLWAELPDPGRLVPVFEQAREIAWQSSAYQRVLALDVAGDALRGHKDPDFGRRMQRALALAMLKNRQAALDHTAGLRAEGRLTQSQSFQLTAAEISNLGAMGRVAEGVSLGRQVLLAAGTKLPVNPSKLKIGLAHRRIGRALDGFTGERLRDHPDAPPALQARHCLLSSLGRAAFMGGLRRVFAQVTQLALDAELAEGFTPMAPLCFQNQAILTALIDGDLPKALRIGRFSLKLSERFDYSWHQPWAQMLHWSTIGHLGADFDRVIKGLDDCRNAATAAGDLNTARYLLGVYLLAEFLVGKSLNRPRMADALEGFDSGMDSLLSEGGQSMRWLRGLETEHALNPRWRQDWIGRQEVFAGLNQLMVGSVLCFSGRRPEALQRITVAWLAFRELGPSLHRCFTEVLLVLLSLDGWRNGSVPRRVAVARAARFKDAWTQWHHAHPQNWVGIGDLVGGMKALAESRFGVALDRLERAVVGCEVAGLQQYAAWAAEAAGEAATGLGGDDLAVEWAEKSRLRYRSWGRAEGRETTCP